MKKGAYIAITVLSMLIVSRFVIRIIDATLPIEGAVWLALLGGVVGVNVFIGCVSYRLYKRKKK